MIYDVVVVGAGPTGSLAAKYVALNGAKVLLIEEHSSIGSPVECTGLLSTKAIYECDLSPSDSFILNKISSAYVYSPNGNFIDVQGKDIKAYVVSRKSFDQTLTYEAIKSGVTLLLNTKLVDICSKNEYQHILVIKNGTTKSIKTKIIIGADGIKSNVAKLSGLGNVKKVLSGIQIETQYMSRCPDHVELFLGSCAPGFFAWTVPINEKLSRIGLAIDSNSDMNALEYLNNFCEQNSTIKGNRIGSVLDLSVGCIPLGTLKSTVSHRTLIVGDAAGQVKPTSGGGIYPGAVCAKIAGEVAANAALNNNLANNHLIQYETKWRKSIGKELDIGFRFRKISNNFSDNDWNEIISALNNDKVRDIITEYGDIDHPSVLMKKLISLKTSSSLIKLLKVFTRNIR